MFSQTTHNTIFDPDEINNNFYWGAQGSLSPKGGGYLFPTTGVNNIGSSTQYFDTFYGRNLNNSALYTDQTWTFVSEQIVISATSRIEFAGLNGDSDTEYMIFTFATYSSACSYYMSFNQVSSYACGVMSRKTEDAAITYTRNSTTSILINNISNAYLYSFCQTLIQTETGKSKIIIQNMIYQAGVTSIIDSYYYGYIGAANLATTNTASTITSIQFYCDSATAYWGSGSYIGIWKRGK